MKQYLNVDTRMVFNYLVNHKAIDSNGFDHIEMKGIRLGADKSQVYIGKPIVDTSEYYVLQQGVSIPVEVQDYELVSDMSISVVYDVFDISCKKVDTVTWTFTKLDFIENIDTVTVIPLYTELCNLHK